MNPRGERLDWLVVRMACEGMPVAAVARVLELDFSVAQIFLRRAFKNGKIAHMPADEWPADSRVVDRRPSLPPMNVDEIRTTAITVRTALGMATGEASVIASLVHLGRVDNPTLKVITGTSAGYDVLKVFVSRARSRVRRSDIGADIINIHGWGYCMSDADRAKIKNSLMRTGGGNVGGEIQEAGAAAP